MPSISFQRSSEGVSSLSNQYQNLILVTCFEVTDFIFSRACLNQNLDTVNSTIDRDLCDTRETKNDISQRIWGIVHVNVSKGNVLIQTSSAIVHKQVNTLQGQSDLWLRDFIFKPYTQPLQVCGKWLFYHKPSYQQMTAWTNEHLQFC